MPNIFFIIFQKKFIFCKWEFGPISYFENAEDVLHGKSGAQHL
jgi:hypothetical protein